MASARRRMRIGPPAVLGLVLISITFSQTAAGQRVLRGAGVVSSPARYTELYFQRPGALPASLPVGGKQLAVAFQLHNREATGREYHWRIVAVRAGRTTELGRGTTVLGTGEHKLNDERVRVRCTGGRVRIDVVLAAPATSIGFWTKCARRPGARRGG